MADESENHKPILIRLGRACDRMGDRNDAVEDYSKALAIVEKHGRRHAEYGESAENLRRLIREAGGAEKTANCQDG